MNDLTLAKKRIRECLETKNPKLNLRYCEITDLNYLPELQECVHLQNLDLSYNKISDISVLKELKQLQNLYLYDNQISDISALKELKQLQYLYLWKNQISDISVLKELKQLQNLDLGSNQISDISVLKELKQLQDLNLSDNQISDISVLKELKQLQDLDLSNNQISDISVLKELKQLQVLYLSDNQISDIKPLKNIVENPIFNIIWIDDNPYFKKKKIILDKYQNHKDTLLNELSKLRDIEEGKQVNIQYPIKICLLGNHHSGKTTFLEYFFTGEIKKKKSTHILNIQPFYSKIKEEELPAAIFYDFGGQDYYHGIYKAFLTESSTNLLFWHRKTDKNEIGEDFSSDKNKTFHFNRQYWLGQLEFAEEKNNLLNVYQIQTFANKDTRQDIHINEHTEKYFHIRLDSDALGKANSKAALELLKEELLEKITTRPKKEISIREKKLHTYILNNREQENELKVSDLLEQYNTAEKDISNLQAELELLSQRGMVLYYNSESLKNTVWINPQKTVEEIHEIFNKENLLRENNGRISKSDFDKSIDENLIELLKHSKVIFLDENSKKEEPTYIVPSYLKSATDEGDESFIFHTFNRCNFSLKFENFIPFGFINQLICKYGDKDEIKSYRKDQLVFFRKSKSGNDKDVIKVFIRLDYQKLLIEVGIDAPKADVKEIEEELFFDLLAVYNGKGKRLKSISDLFIKKENGIRKLGKSDIPPDMYLSLNGKDYIHYQTLEDETKTKNEIIAYKIIEDKTETKNNGDLDKDNAVTLSSRNFARFSNNQNIKKMKKIFISYSRKDVEYKDALKKHLNMLSIFDIADNWSCEEITIGKWHEQIQRELEASDLIIYMLSVNFFNSTYILEHEVLKGLELVNNNKDKNVLCVIVSDFIGLDKLKDDNVTYNELQKSILSLTNFQYLPYVKEPEDKVYDKRSEFIKPLIRHPKNEIDMAFTQIVEKVQKLFK